MPEYIPGTGSPFQQPITVTGLHPEDEDLSPVELDSAVVRRFYADMDILRKKYDPKIYNYDAEMRAIALIFEFAARVQAQKGKTYLGSWKKRGWVVSVFGNISRKFDRLEGIFLDPQKVIDFVLNPKENALEEPVVDTFIDLGVYCFLAASELMLSKPAMFDSWLHRNGITKP